MRKTLYVTPGTAPVWEEAREFAAVEGKSISEYVADALRDYAARRKRAAYDRARAGSRSGEPLFRLPKRQKALLEAARSVATNAGMSLEDYVEVCVRTGVNIERLQAKRGA